ncbi:MAG: hypothetical protein ACLPKE_30590 [Streptosporangiaceae bacterium]
MKAAVIDSLERGPRFADFAEPVVTGGETLVEVTATGLHPIVRMLASGEHYGSQGMLPIIPRHRRHGPRPGRHPGVFRWCPRPWGPMAQRAAAGGSSSGPEHRGNPESAVEPPGGNPP